MRKVKAFGKQISIAFIAMVFIVGIASAAVVTNYFTATSSSIGITESITGGVFSIETSSNPAGNTINGTINLTKHTTANVPVNIVTSIKIGTDDLADTTGINITYSGGGVDMIYTGSSSGGGTSVTDNVLTGGPDTVIDIGVTIETSPALQNGTYTISTVVNPQ